MRNREHEIILGAVVFIAAIIVVVGSVWLSEKYAGAAGGYKLNVQFVSVPGLQVGNQVTFQGVWVGKVLGIWLENGQPIVQLGFANIDGLPKDSEITLKADGLLGGQMIEIKMGVSSDVWPDGTRIVGTSGAGIERVMAEGGNLVAKVNTTWDQMASDKNLTHISNTLANLDSTTQILNSIWNQNQANLNALLDSLALASGDASGMLSENRDDLRASVKNMKQSSEQLVRLTEDVQVASVSLRTTLDNLNQITSHIRDGKGTVGRLVQDDQVYEHLERTLSTVDSLVEDIKRDPTRYFNFSVF